MTMMNNQVFYTVLSGTVVFVLGQILQKFILESIQKYKSTVGRIDNKLKFYANILTNTIFSQDKNMMIEITDTMRNLSCDIESDYKQIPFSVFFSKIRVVENKKNVAKAAQGLIFLSNAGGRRDSGMERCDEKIDEIRKLLGIKSLN